LWLRLSDAARLSSPTPESLDGSDMTGIDSRAEDFCIRDDMGHDRRRNVLSTPQDQFRRHVL